MATFRASWFYVDTVNNTGWTETFFATATTPQQVPTIVSNYITVRKALMMDTGAFVGLRVSNIDSPRDSLWTYTGAGTTGTIAHATYPQKGVEDCVLMRWSNSTAAAFWHTFLHDVPATLFAGRTYTPPGSLSAWTAAMAAYISEVTSGNYYKFRRLSGTPTLTGITTGVDLRWTVRRMGRPFDTLRGRRIA
jgi:hypothetical protein